MISNSNTGYEMHYNWALPPLSPPPLITFLPHFLTSPSHNFYKFKEFPLNRIHYQLYGILYGCIINNLSFFSSLLTHSWLLYLMSSLLSYSCLPSSLLKFQIWSVGHFIQCWNHVNIMTIRSFTKKWPLNSELFSYSYCKTSKVHTLIPLDNSMSLSA